MFFVPPPHLGGGTGGYLFGRLVEHKVDFCPNDPSFGRKSLEIVP